MNNPIFHGVVGATTTAAQRRSVPAEAARVPRGFTLIELMIVVSVIAILAAIAIPSYSAYVFRSRVPPGLNALTALATRMEQRYQDTGNYGTTACSVPASTAGNFAVTCVLTLSGQGFVATATGSGSLLGANYTIDHLGTRRTLAHPRGVPATDCWTLGGARCDA